MHRAQSSKSNKKNKTELSQSELIQFCFDRLTFALIESKLISNFTTSHTVKFSISLFLRDCTTVSFTTKDKIWEVRCVYPSFYNYVPHPMGDELGCLIIKPISRYRRV